MANQRKQTFVQLEMEWGQIFLNLNGFAEYSFKSPNKSLMSVLAWVVCELGFLLNLYIISSHKLHFKF